MARDEHMEEYTFEARRVGINWKRIILIALIVIVIAAFIFTLFEDEEPEVSRSSLPNVPALETDPVGEVAQQSPAYQEALQRANQAITAESLNKRSSSVETVAPTPSVVGEERPTTIPPVLPSQASAAPTRPQVSVSASPQRLRNNNTQSVKSAKRDRMVQFMTSLTQNASPGATSVIEIELPEERIEDLSDQANDQPVAPSRLLAAQAGEILYAELVTTANSDVGGPVVADLLIAEGPLTGGRLIGEFQRRGLYLDVRFRRIALKSGQTLAFNAVALDVVSSEIGVRSSVDRRLIQRYGVPFIASFLQGLGAAAARTTSTTRLGEGDTVIIDENEFSAGEIALAGVSEGAGRIAADLANVAQTVQPLVTLKRGSGVGILLLDDLEI